MPTTALTIVLVVSWLLLFIGLFVFDKLHRRVVAMQVQQQYLLRSVQAIADKLQVTVSSDSFTVELLGLIREGKTYEALTAYRAVKGVSYHEAKSFIDSLKSS